MTKGKKNSISLNAIGKTIKTAREDKFIQITNVEKSTDLSYNTISKLEKGGDITLSSFLKICFALEIHPKDLLDIKMDVTLPGFPAKKYVSAMTSPRIEKLIELNYFENWLTSGEVKDLLNEDWPVEVESNNVSTILERLHRKEKLMKQYNSKGLKEFKKA